jgi:DNA polymerase delta subunit 2
MSSDVDLITALCLPCVFAAEPGRLDLLSKTLTWRHLAPTAPDTLTCYPFADDDPFVLQQTPHILFAANQPQFETRVMEGRGC